MNHWARPRPIAGVASHPGTVREATVQPTLVELAITGDEEAFISLMIAAGDRLLAIAFRILRDLGRAEDAVQIALVSAWRDLPTLRDALLFEAWMTKLLVRAVNPMAPVMSLPKPPCSMKAMPIGE